MEAINSKFVKHLQKMGFNANFAHGFYTFANKQAGEGFTLRVEGDKFTIQDFAFIEGEQVIGEAASESVVKGIEYLEDVLNITEQDTQQTLGPHAEVATVSDNVPVESETTGECTFLCPYGDLTIAEAAVQQHPGSILALLGLQRTHESLVKHLPKSGKPAYVEGHTMIREANLAFLFNWDNEVVDVREDDFEISVIVKCTFRFTEGFEVVKTQCGQADKKFSKKLKTNGEPRLILIGDTIKAATTDGIKKCMSELGINQDVYAGEWSKNDKK